MWTSGATRVTRWMAFSGSSRPVEGSVGMAAVCTDVLEDELEGLEAVEVEVEVRLGNGCC